jgi:poly-beta-1,6-N-acetyl-D-glucosamine synthase
LDFTSLLALALISCAMYYVVVQAGLLLGLLRLKKPCGQIHPFVSVIVAARNEQSSIGSLLQALLNQTYSSYEVIIVDDRSSDNTADIVRFLQQSDSRLKLVTVDSLLAGMPPKKSALTEGIRVSKGEILCFTDADCLPSRTWIETLVSYFDERVGVVAGYSPYDAELLPAIAPRTSGMKWLQRFVEGEEFKGAIWSAGSIGMNLAWLCTGRNLAYRRAVFDQVGGFEQIKMSISGDDDLFIQLVRRQTNWNINFASSPNVLVRTAPPGDFAGFVQQRTRHFSAGKYFTLPMKAFFFLFHLSNLVLLLGLLTLFFSLPLFQIAMSAFAIKLGSDLLLTFTAIRVLLKARFRERFDVMNFLLVEILYILYNTFIGPLGFINTYRWKQD